MDDYSTPPPPSDPAATPNTEENPLLRASNPLVSDLEQEVLDEYTRLLGNVNKVNTPPSFPYIILLSQNKEREPSTNERVPHSSYPILSPLSPAPPPL